MAYNEDRPSSCVLGCMILMILGLLITIGFILGRASAPV